MKTAEDIFLEILDVPKDRYGIPSSVKRAMIEFAKMHVKAALKTALEEVPYGSSTDTVSYEDVKGILTCYPLTNIK